mmetsp:Transcript_34318/g.80282  ORF Transcript_34318/g.80282 Transcript_34318/m.80282 type:complete len:209 (-) Transcript_34318:237-863(-)|eukprot:CAMPEP_0178414382 /NCGR_PEP_ID=MMETSP0689_2-20121128/23007_1 /TAXON_ID=160604 /ORGANISM="Amphidinium massartii, Strain CS-259" /LENGTH=208 /DNA_ID=CAMNT_0020035669 /DNA_START=78 /DNA_END=704 /DNA_ORIENTATION=+
MLVQQAFGYRLVQAPLPPMAFQQQAPADEGVSTLARGGCPKDLQSPLDRYFDPVREVTFGPMVQVMPPTLPPIPMGSGDGYSSESTGADGCELAHRCSMVRTASNGTDAGWASIRTASSSPVAARSSELDDHHFADYEDRRFVSERSDQTFDLDEKAVPSAVFVDLSCLRRPVPPRRMTGGSSGGLGAMRKKGSRGGRVSTRMQQGIP